MLAICLSIAVIIDMRTIAREYRYTVCNPRALFAVYYWRVVDTFNSLLNSGCLESGRSKQAELRVYEEPIEAHSLTSRSEICK